MRPPILGLQPDRARTEVGAAVPVRGADANTVALVLLAASALVSVGATFAGMATGSALERGSGWPPTTATVVAS